MKTLRTKILLGFIISITITFFGLLYLVNMQIKNINIPLTENLDQQIIDAKAKEVGTWLYQRISELRVISLNEDFKNMDMDKIKPFVRSLNNNLNNKYGNDTESFAISNLEGKGWISDEITIDIKNRDYFKEALTTDNEFVIGNPIISRSNSIPIVIISYPIYNYQGRKAGLIDGAVTLSKLSEIASSITMHDGAAWIMDGEGNIFTSIPANNNKEYNSFTKLTSDKKGQINIKEMAQYGYKGFEEVYKVMKKSKSGVNTIVNPDGGHARLFYSSIPYAEGWFLGIVITEDKMYADTNRLIQLISIFGALVLIASILISIFFASSVVRPVRKLQELMTKVEGGNLDIHYDYTGCDEIAQLGKSFNSMILKIKELISKVYMEQMDKRKAELEVLQSQIKPHFLYNTLDTIQWKAIEHNAFEVADMITALSNLFRISISKGEEVISLEEEIEHVRSYLFIQRIRYQDTLDYQVEYEESLKECKVLKLIIQPVVENAIYHGIKNRRGKGFISIKISQEKKLIVIQIVDNGIGIKEERLAEIKSYLNGERKKGGSIGYGLYNVNERIRLEYGLEYGINVCSKYGEGAYITIKIPVIREGEADAKSTHS